MSDTAQRNSSDRYPWWAALKHGGMLIAPAKLADFFPEKAELLSRFLADRLRRNVTQLAEGDDESIPALLDTVLEEILGLKREGWRKGSQVGAEWAQRLITGETLKPRRLWIGEHGAQLPLFVDADTTRLGVGRGRRMVARVTEWLRRSNQRIALLTNGQQWRLIHAGSDYDAWCEWDVAFWFEEGEPSRQVDALRILLSMGSLTPAKAASPSPLLAAIQASRQGQAELSAVLGERVRQAVELLIKESAPALEQLLQQQEAKPIANQTFYIAACRMIMRCVIILFAEARDLLPRDNAIYHSSYGIQGLREQLDRLAGGRSLERLRHGYSAWPRLLALFRLVYAGSAHEALPIPAYRGELFAPGEADGDDELKQALAAFEDVNHCPSDAAVHRILDLLTRSQVKVRQGKGSIWVDAPVDFSDLSSEYIGILYQGLLDFELRQATSDEPILFLNLGDQPALPLARLEAMDDSALATLLEKLRKSAKPSGGEEESNEEDAAESEEVIEEEVAEEEPVDTESVDTEKGDIEPLDAAFDPLADDKNLQVRMRAIAWAQRAVESAGLVRKPQTQAASSLDAYQNAVQKMAEQLIPRVVLPGEWFLVRWGGTRKGAGTFYTRPQLGTPLVRRTLEPLLYVETDSGTVNSGTVNSGARCKCNSQPH